VKRYNITLYKVYQKVSYYTIHSLDDKLCETDKFFNRFKDDPIHLTDIQTIKYWMERMGDNQGAMERHFRPEKRAHAIPILPQGSKLRLYCYRLNDRIVVLGNGGIKSSRAAQGSEETRLHFELVNSLAFVLQQKIAQQTIIIDEASLRGNLQFYTKPKKDERDI